MTFLTRCLIALLVGSSGAFANELHVRNILQQNHMFFEAAVRMHTLIEAAIGNKQKSTCIHNLYFGSPTYVRLVVNQLWAHSEIGAPLIAQLQFDRWCSGYAEPGDPPERLWSHTNTDHIQLDGNGGPMIDAGLRMLLVHAHAAEQTDAFNCIVDKYSNSGLFEQIEQAVAQRPGTSVTAITFDMVREECGYPANSGPSGTVNLPRIVDAAGAARERLLAVRDLQSCEQRSDDTQREQCVRELSDARADEISEAALRVIDEELEAVQAEREQMRQRAWRLPDGRLIFQDGNIWRFEDGSIVPPELVATRIPPP